MAGRIVGPVSYAEMVSYVARVTDPMIEHVREHDDWHRDRVDLEDAARRANRRATISQALTAAALVVAIVTEFWHR